MKGVFFFFEAGWNARVSSWSIDILTLSSYVYHLARYTDLRNWEKKMNLPNPTLVSVLEIVNHLVENVE